MRPPPYGSRLTTGFLPEALGTVLSPSGLIGSHRVIVPQPIGPEGAAMKRREFITLLGGALGIVRENRDLNQHI